MKKISSITLWLIYLINKKTTTYVQLLWNNEEKKVKKKKNPARLQQSICTVLWFVLLTACAEQLVTLFLFLITDQMKAESNRVLILLIKSKHFITKTQLKDDMIALIPGKGRWKEWYTHVAGRHMRLESFSKILLLQFVNLYPSTRRTSSLSDYEDYRGQQ